MTQGFVQNDAGHLPLLRRDGSRVAWALVDADTFDAVAGHRWRLLRGKYAVRTVAGRDHFLAREVLGLGPGSTPQVRFFNGSTLDCRRSNLVLPQRMILAHLREHEGLRAAVLSDALADLAA